MSWLQSLFATGWLALALLVLPSSAHALEAAAAMQQLHYFVGEWHAEGMPGACDTHALQAPQRDGVKLIVHRAMGGAWFAFSWLAYHAGQRSEGVTLMGYDPSQEQYVQHDTTSAGAHGQAQSAGWQDDTLVCQGTLHNWQGGSLTLRKTYRKVDATHFILTVEGSANAQAWEKLVEVSFAR